jgi:uncharacterized repeat protein (TIGR01451 family)
LSLAAFLLSAAQTAQAVGTQAGTSVDNQAVVAYDVGLVSQSPIPSSPTGNSDPTAGAPTTFLVDRKIDLTIAAIPGPLPGYIDVTPGATTQVLAYDVTNTSNDVLDFALSHAFQAGGADPYGGTDNVDSTLVGVFVDTDADNTYTAADTDTFIDELSATAGSNTIRVFVVSNFPLPGPPWADGDVSAQIVTATAREGGGVGALGVALTADPGPEDPAVEETVFADAAGDTDAARNADHSDTHAYRVRTATLTVAKTSTVMSDGVNVAPPYYPIPGAVIRYEVTITNTGTVTASNVTVRDDLSTVLDAATGTLTFNEDTWGADNDIQLEHSVAGISNYTREPGDDDGEIGTLVPDVDVLIVQNVTLAPGENATVRFELTVR